MKLSSHFFFWSGMSHVWHSTAQFTEVTPGQDINNTLFKLFYLIYLKCLTQDAPSRSDFFLPPPKLSTWINHIKRDAEESKWNTQVGEDGGDSPLI